MAGTAARSIVRFVSPTAMGPIKRLVGSVDCKGKGTKHEIESIDPVVMCDFASISGIGNPKFGLHPHYGLIAVTTVVEGCFSDGDNLNEPDGHINEAGGIYMVSSGRGVCHQEASAAEGKHVAIQTIIKIPDDKKDLLPELVKIPPTDIPELGLTGGSAKLLVGRLGDVESPAKVKSLPRIVFLMLKVDAQAKMEVPLDSDIEHGFLYVINGKCKIAGAPEEWCEAGKGMWMFGAGKDLGLEAGDEGVQVFLVAGKPLNEPWVKMLGNNGFIVAGDEEEAEKVMEVIHKTGKEFNYHKL